MIVLDSDFEREVWETFNANQAERNRIASQLSEVDGQIAVWLLDNYPSLEPGLVQGAVMFSRGIPDLSMRIDTLNNFALDQVMHKHQQARWADQNSAVEGASGWSNYLTQTRNRTLRAGLMVFDHVNQVKNNVIGAFAHASHAAQDDSDVKPLMAEGVGGRLGQAARLGELIARTGGQIHQTVMDPTFHKTLGSDLLHVADTDLTHAMSGAIRTGKDPSESGRGVATNIVPVQRNRPQEFDFYGQPWTMGSMVRKTFLEDDSQAAAKWVDFGLNMTWDVLSDPLNTIDPIITANRAARAASRADELLAGTGLSHAIGRGSSAADLSKVLLKDLAKAKKAHDRATRGGYNIFRAPDMRPYSRSRFAGTVHESRVEEMLEQVDMVRTADWAAGNESYVSILKRVKDPEVALGLHDATTRAEAFDVLRTAYTRGASHLNSRGAPWGFRFKDRYSDKPLGRLITGMEALTEHIPSLERYSKWGNWTPTGTIELTHPTQAIPEFRDQLINMGMTKDKVDSYLVEFARAVTSGNTGNLSGMMDAHNIYGRAIGEMRTTLVGKGIPDDIVDRALSIATGDGFIPHGRGRAYFIDEEATMLSGNMTHASPPHVRVSGNNIAQPSPTSIVELLDPVIFGTNPREIRRLTSRTARIRNKLYDTTSSLEDTPEYRKLVDKMGLTALEKAKVGTNILTDVAWAATRSVFVPMQLITRVAWPMRIFAEEQLRMMMVGAPNIYSHPLQLFSYMLADSGLIETNIQRLNDSVGSLPGFGWLEGVEVNIAQGYGDLTGAVMKNDWHLRQNMVTDRMASVTGHDPRVGRKGWSAVDMSLANRDEKIRYWQFEMDKNLGDPVLQQSARILRGVTQPVSPEARADAVQQLVDWLSAPEQRDLIDTFNGIHTWDRVDEKMVPFEGYDNPDNIRSLAELHIKRTMQATRGEANLLDMLAYRTVGDVDIAPGSSVSPSRREKVIREALRDKVDRDVYPQFLVAPDESPFKLSSATKQFFTETWDRWWSLLGAYPSNTWSRAPLFRAVYWQRAVAMFDRATPEVQKQIMDGVRGQFKPLITKNGQRANLPGWIDSALNGNRDSILQYMEKTYEQNLAVRAKLRSLPEAIMVSRLPREARINDENLIWGGRASAKTFGDGLNEAMSQGRNASGQFVPPEDLADDIAWFIAGGAEEQADELFRLYQERVTRIDLLRDIRNKAKNVSDIDPGPIREQLADLDQQYLETYKVAIMRALEENENLGNAFGPLGGVDKEFQSPAHSGDAQIWLLKNHTTGEVRAVYSPQDVVGISAEDLMKNYEFGVYNTQYIIGALEPNWDADLLESVFGKPDDFVIGMMSDMTRVVEQVVANAPEDVGRTLTSIFDHISTRRIFHDLGGLPMYVNLHTFMGPHDMVEMIDHIEHLVTNVFTSTNIERAWEAWLQSAGGTFTAPQVHPTTLLRNEGIGTFLGTDRVPTGDDFMLLQSVFNTFNASDFSSQGGLNVNRLERWVATNRPALDDMFEELRRTSLSHMLKIDPDTDAAVRALRLMRERMDLTAKIAEPQRNVPTAVIDEMVDVTSEQFIEIDFAWRSYNGTALGMGGPFDGGSIEDVEEALQQTYRAMFMLDQDVAIPPIDDVQDHVGSIVDIWSQARNALVDLNNLAEQAPDLRAGTMRSTISQVVHDAAERQVEILQGLSDDLDVFLATHGYSVADNLYDWFLQIDDVIDAWGPVGWKQPSQATVDHISAQLDDIETRLADFQVDASGNRRFVVGDADLFDSLDDFDLAAKAHALDFNNQLLYNLNNKGQFAESMRVMAPFMEAFKEIVATWSRLFTQNPLRARRIGQGHENASESGLFYRDPATGQESFSSPAGPLGNILFGQDDLSLNAPSDVLGLNFAFGNGFGPGLGPFASTPVGLLLEDRPRTGDLYETLLPFGTPIKKPADLANMINVSKLFVPSWIQKVANQWTEGAWDEYAWYSHLHDTSRALAATGRYTVSDRERLEADASKLASKTGYLRAFGQAVFPMPFRLDWQVQLPEADKNLAAVMDQILPHDRSIGRHDQGWWSVSVLGTFMQQLRFDAEDELGAMHQFMQLVGWDPDDYDRLYATAVISQAKTASTGSSPETIDGAEWIEQHQDLISKYPATIGYFAPATGPARGVDGFFKDIEEGRRVVLSPETFLNLASQTIGKAIYDNKVLPLGDRQDPAARAYRQQWVQYLDELMPRWDPVRYENFRPGNYKFEDRMYELEQAVNEPDLVATDAGQALVKYMAKREELISQIMQMDDVNSRKAALTRLRQANLTENWRAWLNQWGTYLVKEHPEFATIWERTLAYEVEPEQEPAEVTDGTN